MSFIINHMLLNTTLASTLLTQQHMLNRNKSNLNTQNVLKNNQKEKYIPKHASKKDIEELYNEKEYLSI